MTRYEYQTMRDGLRADGLEMTERSQPHGARGTLHSAECRNPDADDETAVRILLAARRHGAMMYAVYGCADVIVQYVDESTEPATIGGAV